MPRLMSPLTASLLLAAATLAVLPRAMETAERLRPVVGPGPQALGPTVTRCDLCELLDFRVAAIAGMPSEVRAALLPTALVEPYLGLMERPSYAPLGVPVDLPGWRRLWILWRAARAL